jgi:hypothetical protein
MKRNWTGNAVDPQNRTKSFVDGLRGDVNSRHLPYFSLTLQQLRSKSSADCSHHRQPKTILKKRNDIVLYDISISILGLSGQCAIQDPACAATHAVSEYFPRGSRYREPRLRFN